MSNKKIRDEGAVRVLEREAIKLANLGAKQDTREFSEFCVGVVEALKQILKRKEIINKEWTVLTEAEKENLVRAFSEGIKRAVEWALMEREQIEENLSAPEKGKKR